MKKKNEDLLGVYNIWNMLWLAIELTVIALKNLQVDDAFQPSFYISDILTLND